MTYRPGWQSGDGRQVSLPTKFVATTSANRMPTLAAYLGGVTWDFELLKGNQHDKDSPPSGEEDLVASQAEPGLSGNNNTPPWTSTKQLTHMARQLGHKAWTKTFGPGIDTGPSLFTSGASMRIINTTPIVWQPSETGICLLDLFGGISTGLAAVLQAGILVRKYLYVENDDTAHRVSL